LVLKAGLSGLVVKRGIACVLSVLLVLRLIGELAFLQVEPEQTRLLRATGLYSRVIGLVVRVILLVR
jgi:hypothetical protein